MFHIVFSWIEWNTLGMGIWIHGDHAGRGTCLAKDTAWPHVLGMKTSQTFTTDAVLLAHLLDRLEGKVTPDAAQYRLVAQRLGQALSDLPAGDALDAVLRDSPAATLLYENLNYHHAGLCRSSLDTALAAEISARDAISRAMRPTPAHGTAD